MRWFTRMLLLAAWTLLPTLLVTGNPGDSQLLQPSESVHYAAQQRNIAIRNTLAPSHYTCLKGSYLCRGEGDYVGHIGCCPNEMQCCKGLFVILFFNSLTYFQFNIFQIVTAVMLGE